MRKLFGGDKAPIPRRWRERPIDDGKQAPKAEVATSSLASYRLLVLLGEAGFGKTVAMVGLERASPLKPEGQTLWISCGQYPSVEELRRVVFRGVAWSKWRLDGGRFELYLDSFDEFLAPKELAQMLVEELEAVRRGELCLRIACRTAVWPSTLQQQLIELFSAEPATVGVFELQPFNAPELREFVEQRLLDRGDAAAFLTKVDRESMDSLTSRPLLVELLLADFTPEQEFGVTRREVYEKGLRAILDEQRGVEDAEKWRAAEHLALEIVLSGTSRFPPENPVTPRGAVLASELFAREDSPDGPVRTCHHRTFAEHLAARALDRLCTSSRELEQLHVIVDGGVPPQLRELAARLAETSAVMRDWLVANQPDVLTSSDPTAMSAQSKKEVVSVILEACADGKISTHLSGWERTFGNLVTDDSMDLLDALIRGKNNRDRPAALVARRLAISAAERVHATSLAPALVDVALAVADGRPDPDTPDARLHFHAGSAFLQIWKECPEHEKVGMLAEQRERFRGLLDMSRKRDENGDYRGLALTLLWPDAISVETLIASLKTYKHHGAWGFYDSFVTHELPRSFDRSDVIIKLLEHYDGVRMRPFADKLADAAWRLRADASVWRALLTVMIRYSGRERDIRLPSDDLAAQTNDRREFTRQLIRAIVALPDEDPDKIRWTDHHAIWLWLRELYSCEDLGYWLTEHAQASDLMERLFMFHFIRQAVDVASDDDVRIVREHGRGESDAARELRERFKWITSEEVLTAVRTRHHQPPDEEPRVPKRPAIARLRMALEQAEADPMKDWWQIVVALAGRDDRERDANPLSTDLFKLWDELRPDEQRRAASVLRTALNDPENEFPARNPDGTVRRGTLWAVRSLGLLAHIDDAQGLGLNDATWRRIADAIVEHGDLIPHQAADRIDGLLRRHVPMIGLRLLNHTQMEEFPHVPAARMVELWTRELRDKILPRLDNRSLPVGLDRELLRRLASKGDRAAIQIAYDRVVAKSSSGTAQEDTSALDEATARQFASALALISAPESGDEKLIEAWILLMERSSGVAFHLAAEFGRDRFHRSYPTPRALRLDKIPAKWLARIWRRLAKVVPADDEPDTSLARIVGDREYAQMGRDEVISVLRERASPDDVAALREFAKEHDPVTFVWMANEAEQRRRRTVWSPLVPSLLQALLGGLEHRPRTGDQREAGAAEGALRSQADSIGRPGHHTRPGTEMPQVLNDVNRVVLLVTAVRLERTALTAVLSEDYSVRPSLYELDGRYFDNFLLPGRNGSWDVYVGQPTEKGGMSTNTLVHDFVKAKRPSLVLMIGMCGGLPEHGACEGMVVVARHVFNYEPARLRGGASDWNPGSYRCSATLIDLANALVAQGAFGDIDVKSGKDYASGDKLIDDLKSELRQKVVELSGDVLAFEMEGPGLLHAIWELERATHFPVGIVKGISDFGDGNLRDDKEARQGLAARNASRVALKMLSEY